jgi:hypothetical protein
VRRGPLAVQGYLARRATLEAHALSPTLRDSCAIPHWCRRMKSSGVMKVRMSELGTHSPGVSGRAGSPTATRTLRRAGWRGRVARVCPVSCTSDVGRSRLSCWRLPPGDSVEIKPQGVDDAVVCALP